MTARELQNETRRELLEQLQRDAQILDSIQNETCCDLQQYGLNWQTIHGAQLALQAVAAELRTAALIVAGTCEPGRQSAEQMNAAALFLRAAGFFCCETAKEDAAAGLPDYGLQAVATGGGSTIGEALRQLENARQKRAAISSERESRSK